MSGAARRARVAQAIRTELSDLVRELKDTRVRAAELVSINHVELNRDLSVATVYVGFPGSDERTAQAALGGLTAAAGFLRGPLARRIHLARAPELRFAHDMTAAFSERLRDIVREDEARHVEPEIGTSDDGGGEAAGAPPAGDGEEQPG